MLKKIIRLILAPYHYVYMMSNECSNYNTANARKKCRTKQRSKKLFKKNKIPTAEYEIFINPIRAFAFVKKHGFPVVVKPNFGGYSRGSFFPINDKISLLKACFLVKFYWPKTIIEKYLLGKNYRVLVVYGKVITAIQRYSPFVIGNGKDSISTLIKQENIIRKEMNLHPVIHPILESGEVILHLKKQNLNLNSILKKNERIFVHNKLALNPGGIVKTLSADEITAKNKELFIKINSIIGADVLGIDVIMKKGISTDYDKQNCIFLELNSRPYLHMHLFPRYGEKVDVKTIIDKL